MMPADPQIVPTKPVEPTRQGDVIAGFQVERLIARGPQASVYRARRQNEYAAIKIYPPGQPGVLAARVSREQIAQRSVVHPCVARLHDWGRLPDGCPYLISQWIEGIRLEDRIARGPMPWAEVAPIAADLARGLGAIHAAQIVHRDLKPANIMLPSFGAGAAASAAAARYGVILDFGHSLALDADRLTDTGFILGSAAYMAPEQAEGRMLDGRSDLYSLGVVLYRALTGRLPFESKAPADILRQHQIAPVRPLRELVPTIPRPAEDLCLWLLAKSPSERLPNAQVLSVTLRCIPGV